MAKKVISVAEVEAAAKQIQSDHAKTSQPHDPPMTGVEIAVVIASQQPPPEPAGTRYGVRLAGDSTVAPIVVTSQDGTVEDAVRAFNVGRAEIRTAKQLVIEKLSA